MGMKSTAADAAIGALQQAVTLDDLRAGARALDRVLMSGAYAVPLFPRPRPVACPLDTYPAAGHPLLVRHLA